MIELTNEQRQALTTETPARAVDPVTHKTYVIIPSEMYDRLKTAVEDDVRGMQHLLADLSPEDWEDAANYEPKP